MRTHISLLIRFFLVLMMPLFFFSITYGQVVITREAETDFSSSPDSVANDKSRMNACNDHTIWINGTGDEVFWVFEIPHSGDYSLVVRYSNSDTGNLDSISISVDSVEVGQFESTNTGAGGVGWNIFTTSPSISLGILNKGPKTISLRLDEQDGFGIEYDKLTIICQDCPPVSTSEIPKRTSSIKLFQNYPNPFKNITSIPLVAYGNKKAILLISNIIGKLVFTKKLGSLPVGRHEIIWDGRNEHGAKVPNGIYFYRIQIGRTNFTKKMILSR